MPRRRYISTETSVDKAVNCLARDYGDFAVTLYLLLIPHAEDDATVRGDAEEIQFRVVPGRRDRTLQDVVDALAGMQECGLVAVYPDRVEFPTRSFYKHQSYIPANKRRSEGDRRTPQNAEKHRLPSPSPSPSPSSSQPEKPVQARCAKPAPPLPDGDTIGKPGHPDEVDAGDWTGVEAVLEHLRTLNGAVPQGFPIHRLLRPDLWRELIALTEGTEVYLLEELRKYLVWWPTKPPSRRRRNVDSSFRLWIKTALGEEQYRKDRHAAQPR